MAFWPRKDGLGDNIHGVAEIVFTFDLRSFRSRSTIPSLPTSIVSQSKLPSSIYTVLFSGQENRGVRTTGVKG